MITNTIKFFSIFFLIGTPLFSYSQLNKEVLQTDMEPYKMKGRKNPLSKNLSFAEYKTSGVRRKVNTFLTVGTIDPLNQILVIESVPLRRNDKYRNRDAFRFKLKTGDGTYLTTECAAFLKVDERFRLLQKQDSSFWGNRNTDFLIASIVPGSEPSSKWSLVASNLNASKDVEQKGKLVCKDDEISFTVKNLLLKENNNPDLREQKFTSLNMVYAFTYKNEIVGAVSVKEIGRSFWIKKNVDKKIKDAIAATAVILTIRRNLYQ